MNNANIENFIKTHINNDIEIECRFNQPDMLGVNYETFSNVYKRLKANSDYTQRKPEQSQVYALVHKANKKQFRFTQYTDKAPVFETKEKIAVKDFREYNIRIAASKETKLKVTNSNLKTQYNTTNVRTKTRYSFYDDAVSIDLTFVIQNHNGKIQKLYEIECELVDGAKMKKFVKTVDLILSYIQNSKFVTTNAKKQEILNNYAKLLDQKFPKFIGPLPYTISKSQFENGLLSCNYAVTDKADGLRKLMYIDNTGQTILLGRASGKELLSTAIYVGTSSLRNTLYDGELVESTPNVYDYYIFDCLFADNKDVRELNLKDRLKEVVLRTSSPRSSSVKTTPNKLSVKLHKKVFYFENVYTHADKIWQHRANKPYTLDGLVFTPIYTQYYNENIFKWKPVDTIDFFIRKSARNATHESWTLHIAGFNRGGNYQHYTFRGFDGKGSFSYKKGGKTLITRNIIPFHYGNVRVPNKVAQNYRDNVVVEFKFSTSENKFIPLQIREDKSFANGIMAVNDAYISLTKPITTSMLKNGPYVFCGRKYHNAIKNSLIQKYLKKSTVLDIGVGAGGNIHKYAKANVKRLIGINIVPIEYNYDKSKMTFYHVKNTNFYNIGNVLGKSNTKLFDNITCFFAIHYFFKNEKYLQNLYNNVEKSLKPGGHFICTFMDDKAIKNLLKTNSIYNSNVFYLKQNGDDLTVKLKGTKYFAKQSSKEYLVSVQKLKALFTNYKVIEHTSFSEYCDTFKSECEVMSKEEKKFSFLNSTLVLQKKM